jgi:hypothetical protein
LPWLKLVDANVMVVRARHLFRVSPLPLRILRVEVDEIDGHDALRQPKRSFHRVGQPEFDCRLHGQPVNDHVDRVLVLLVQDRRIGELDDLTIHPSAAETF